MSQSLFLDFNLPNSPTWFYFSLFLTAALFLQFNRILSLRNWDLLGLFLFVPGFILIQEANDPAAARLDGADAADRERFIGYLWLLGASAFWFGRCLVDLATIRRPLLSPNLNAPGLIWFGSALFVCLTAVGFTRTDDPWGGSAGKRPVVLKGVERGAAAVVAQTQNGNSSAGPGVIEWVERSFALTCHLGVAAGLIMIGYRHFHDLLSGIAAGTLYLLLPYTAFFIGHVHHVWPAALIVWAVFWYRRPAVAGGVLGVAAGTAFFPALLVPVWLQFYRGCGVGRFATGLLVGGAVGLAATLLVLSLGGEFPTGVSRTLAHGDWQPWKSAESESVWTGVLGAYRLPVFIAYVGFVIAAWLWLPVRNLGQLIAASAAVIIGVQFWYADRGGLYVLWYAPLLVLLVFRPNLSESRPVPPGPLPGAVARAAGWAWKRVRAAPPVASEAASLP